MEKRKKYLLYTKKITLDNGDKTPNEVMAEMNLAPPTNIKWIVRFFENPDSMFALPGAVDLHRHDIIHILLGRGLTIQDEAFVIGFTMGTAKHISNFHIKFYKFISRHLYPKLYRFNDEHLPIYDLGYQCALEMEVKRLHKFPLEDYADTKLAELRDFIGIDVEMLERYYQQEKALMTGFL